MNPIDRWLDRLFDGRLDELVERRVQEALARHRDDDAHLSPDDLLERHLVFGDRARLYLDPTAKVNNALFNVSSGRITVGRYAFFGHNVAVLTGTHDFNKFGEERQNAVPKEGHDVVIGDGVWVASHSLVIGPCTIGENAVVGVGSLVMEDVEPYTIVAGHPAKVVRRVEPGGDGQGEGKGDGQGEGEADRNG